MDMPTYSNLEVHPASRLRISFLAGPVQKHDNAATVQFAACAVVFPSQTLPYDRIKIAYSHSTSKRFALLVALVPVKPN
jgi:hypothetical protein